MPWPVSAIEELDRGGLFDVARADADRRGVRRAHRLLGVEQQVQQRLLQLAAVGRAPRGRLGSKAVSSSMPLRRNS